MTPILAECVATPPPVPLDNEPPPAKVTSTNCSLTIFKNANVAVKESEAGHQEVSSLPTGKN